mmetsp:Transcript_6514/g.11316  ORF Transcript_6514/g.11316 Transcript_6514/m.11316 type:complete len:222 (+) Transcript_6514:140-805(+)
MPIGNVAAAVVGARHGRARAGIARGTRVPVRHCSDRGARSDELEAKRSKAAQELVVLERLVSLYDKDNSGQLDRHELAKLLRDYAAHTQGTAVEPDSDDMDFIMFIVDKDDSGCVDRRELKKALDIWGSFLRERPRIEELFHKYDSDGNCSIEPNELEKLLEELNDGVPVPKEVLQWVIHMGDLTGDGVLSVMELSRAAAAWYANSDDADTPQVSKSCTLL